MMLLSKKGNKRVQASIEYIIVFSLAFIVLLPMIYMFQGYSTKSSEQIVTSNIAVIGNDIVNAAESVYYMGSDSRLTLDETMPEGIKNITLTRDWDKGINEVVFELRNNNTIAFFCNVNIDGSFDTSDFSAGLKRVRVEAKNDSRYDYVSIDIY